MKDPELSQVSLAALRVLMRLPRSISDSLLSDVHFQRIYKLTGDADIVFDGELSVNRSKLFQAIRDVLSDDRTRRIVRDGKGKDWHLSLNPNRLITLVCGGEHHVLPDFSALSPHSIDRLDGFDRVADILNFDEQLKNRWRPLLTSRALTDDELITLHTEMRETPIHLSAQVSEEILHGTSRLSTLIPRTPLYFERLVGIFDKQMNIIDYAQTAAKEHIRKLIAWRPYDGFVQSLLLASNPAITALIDVGPLSEADLTRAYKWIQEKGDRISQLGAIEIALSLLDSHQYLEPFVLKLVEQILSDQADANIDGSRMQLLSGLIVLVDGEISRTNTAKEMPPFWRRLASIAQASLLERCIIASHTDISAFARWALQNRVQQFYLQTIVDLRFEPRWHPDYVSAFQLKAEFIGRIAGAAQRNEHKIKTAVLRELLFEDGANNVKSQLNFPFSFMPGPLEGGIDAQLDTPEWVRVEIERQLSAELIHPQSFTALVNSARIFRLDAREAGLAAKALRAAKYQVRRVGNKENLISVLNGLATVAAVTRSDGLARELITLTRRVRYEQAYNLSGEDALWIGLIAAASHLDLKDWCAFVGDWVTELSLQALDRDEINRLHSNLLTLCDIEPELWKTCGRGEAALKLAVGS